MDTTDTTTTTVLISSVTTVLGALIMYLAKAFMEKRKLQAEARGEEAKADVEAVKVALEQGKLLVFFQTQMRNIIAEHVDLYEKAKATNVLLLETISKRDALIVTLEEDNELKKRMIEERDKIIKVYKDNEAYYKSLESKVENYRMLLKEAELKIQGFLPK